MARRQKLDAILAKDQLQAMQAVLQEWGMRSFLAAYVWILQKTVSGFTDANAAGARLVPFRFNPIQEDIDPKLAQNNIVGKGRQQGFTTYFLLRRLFVPAITQGGIGSLLVGQTGGDASEFLRIAKRAYRFIGAADPYSAEDDEQNLYNLSLRQNLLHTVYSNKKEIVFDYLDSKIRIASAEVEEAGQGLTLHHVLADEYARWPGDPRATLANIRGALVPGGTLDKSSTANGMVGPYFDDFMEAWDTPEKSDSKAHFYAWWHSPDYRMDLTDKEKDELEADLTSDELKIIAQIKKETAYTAYA